MTAEKRVTAFRQEQIVSAATALIAQSGLKGLNMAALARQIGLVPSALYRHYKGKMQIVGIILDRVRENLRANIRAVRESSSEPCGRLRQLLARHLILLKQNPGMTRLVFSDELGSRFPSERAKLYGILMEYLDGIEAIVKEGQKAGCLRRDLPPRACARLFVGMLQSAVLMGHLSGGAMDAATAAEEAWTAFDKALKPA
jgi:AcrR family transcriptional regulator